jgi:hypothetical protein
LRLPSKNSFAEGEFLAHRTTRLHAVRWKPHWSTDQQARRPDCGIRYTDWKLLELERSMLRATLSFLAIAATLAAGDGPKVTPAEQQEEAQFLASLGIKAPAPGR